MLFVHSIISTQNIAVMDHYGLFNGYYHTPESLPYIWMITTRIHTHCNEPVNYGDVYVCVYIFSFVSFSKDDYQRGITDRAGHQDDNNNG